MRPIRFLIIACVIVLGFAGVTFLRFQDKHREPPTAQIELPMMIPASAELKQQSQTKFLTTGVPLRISAPRRIISATLSDDEMVDISDRDQKELSVVGKRAGQVSLILQLEGESVPTEILLKIADRQQATTKSETLASQMAGMWHGDDWGFVELTLKNLTEGRCEGRWGGSTGHRYPITLMQDAIHPYSFIGTWHEFVNDRGSLTLDLSPDGQTITGSWNAKNMQSRPGGKTIGSLRWQRVEPNIDTAKITTKEKPENRPAIWQKQHLVIEKGSVRRVSLPYATEQMMSDDPSLLDLVEIENKEWWIFGKHAGESSWRLFFGQRVHPVDCIVTVLDRDATDKSSSDKATKSAAEISGLWEGKSWGTIELYETEPRSGRYTGRWGTRPERPYRLTLNRSRKDSNLFQGIWYESDVDHGTLTVLVDTDGKTVQGQWSRAPDGRGTELSGTLEWRRVDAVATQQKPLFDIDIETAPIKQQFQLAKGARIRVPLRDTVGALMIDDGEVIEVHHSGRELQIDGKKSGRARVAVLFDLNGEPETYGVTVLDRNPSVELGPDVSQLPEPSRKSDDVDSMPPPVKTPGKRTEVPTPDSSVEWNIEKSAQVQITVKVFGIDQNKLLQLSDGQPAKVHSWLSDEGPWCAINGFARNRTLTNVMETDHANPLLFDVEGHDLSAAFSPVLFETDDPKKKMDTKITIGTISVPVLFDLGSVFNYWWSESATDPAPVAGEQLGKATDLVITPKLNEFGHLIFDVQSVEKRTAKTPAYIALIAQKPIVIRQQMITSNTGGAQHSLFLATLNANQEVTHVVQINTIFLPKADIAGGNEPLQNPIVERGAANPRRSEDMDTDRNLDRDMDRKLTGSPRKNSREDQEGTDNLGFDRRALTPSSATQNARSDEQPRVDNDGRDRNYQGEFLRSVEARPDAQSSRAPANSRSVEADSAQSNGGRNLPLPGSGGSDSLPKAQDSSTVQGIGVLIAKTDDGLAGFSYQKGTWARLKLEPLPDDPIANVTVWRDFAVYRGDQSWYAFDNLTGKWAELKLTPGDTEKLLLTLGGGVGLAYNKHAVHAYVAGSGHWSTVRAPDGTDTEFLPVTGINGEAKVRFGTKLYVITKSSGEWTSPDQIDQKAPILRSDDSISDSPPTLDTYLVDSIRNPALMRDRDGKLWRMRTPPNQQAPQNSSEREAIHLAAQIRRQQKSAQDEAGKNELTELQRKLNEELKLAFDEKLTQEESQIQTLRSRLSQLERQIAERRILREKIIQRRAKELIEGDETKWNRESAPDSRKSTPVESTVSPGATSLNSADQPRVSQPVKSRIDMPHVTPAELHEIIRKQIAGMQRGEVHPRETLDLVTLLAKVDPLAETLTRWEILTTYFTPASVESGVVRAEDKELFEKEFELAKQRIEKNRPTKSKLDVKNEVRPAQEVTDAEIEAAIDNFHKRMASVIEKLQSCQSRVRGLETTYFRDHSNTEELRQALDQLHAARREILMEVKLARDELQPLDNRLAQIAGLAEEIHEAIETQREKTITRIAEGTATQKELRQITDAETRAAEELENAKQRRQKVFVWTLFQLPEGSREFTEVNKIVSDVATDPMDELFVQYWFEAEQGLKVEFIRFDGLSLPFPAALKIREKHGDFQAGDMIIAFGGPRYGFENYSQVRWLLKENERRNTGLIVLRGGLAGTLNLVVQSLGPFNVSPDAAHAIWRFEFRTQSQPDSPSRAIYLNGASVSIDGLVVVPIPPDLNIEGVEINSIFPWKAAAKIVHSDQGHGLLLLKIFDSHKTKLFSWMRCHNLSAALDQNLQMNVWDGTQPISLSAACSAIEPQLGDTETDAAYFYVLRRGLPTDQTVKSLCNVTTVDELHELQGVVLPIAPHPEKGWKCVESKVIAKLVDDYRKKED